MPSGRPWPSPHPRRTVGLLALRDGSSFSCMAPLAAEGILSLLVQRKNQRNTPQAARPALRAGSTSGPGISVRHIHVPYGNAAHPGRRPSGFTRPTRRASWGPQASKSRTAVWMSQVWLSGAPEVRQSRRVKPAGRRTGMCAVFVQGRMPCTKIRAGTANPPRSGGRTAGGCFFCLLFFAQAKKSKAPAASGTMRQREKPIPQGHQTKWPSWMWRQPEQTKETDFVGPLPNPSPAGRGARPRRPGERTPAARV